jgi:hypothetical protein
MLIIQGSADDRHPGDRRPDGVQDAGAPSVGDDDRARRAAARDAGRRDLHARQPGRRLRLWRQVRDRLGSAGHPPGRPQVPQPDRLLRQRRICAYTGDGLIRYDGQLSALFPRRHVGDSAAARISCSTTGRAGPPPTSGEAGCDVIVAYKADKPDAKHPVWPGGRPRFGFVRQGQAIATTRARTTPSPAAPAAPLGRSRRRGNGRRTPIVCWYNWERGVLPTTTSATRPSCWSAAA